MVIITLTFVGLWMCGTALLAVGGLVVAVRELLGQGRILRRLVPSVAAMVVGVVAGLANPIINRAAFKATAREHRARLLEDATTAGCVGKSTAWLEARYGRPYDVRRDARDAAVRQWWYRPGPWYVLHDDSVGFTVVHSVVTGTRASQAADEASAEQASLY